MSFRIASATASSWACQSFVGVLRTHPQVLKQELGVGNPALDHLLGPKEEHRAKADRIGDRHETKSFEQVAIRESPEFLAACSTQLTEAIEFIWVEIRQGRGPGGGSRIVLTPGNHAILTISWTVIGTHSGRPFVSMTRLVKSPSFVPTGPGSARGTSTRMTARPSITSSPTATARASSVEFWMTLCILFDAREELSLRSHNF
jgi:hypothetical protein